MNLKRPLKRPDDCECEPQWFALDHVKMCGPCFFTAFEEAFERGDLPGYRRSADGESIEIDPAMMAEIRAQYGNDG